MGGDKIKEENKPLSSYVQHMNQQAFTCSSDAGADPMFITDMQNPLDVHHIPVTSDKLIVDLNQLYSEQSLLPDLNTIDMVSNNISSVYGQGFYYPQWNLDELPSNAHKTGICDSLMSEQINNLDMKESSTMFYDKHGGDISVQKNHEGSAVECSWPRKIDGNFLSLGTCDSTEVKSRYCINSNNCGGERNRAIFPQLNNDDVQKSLGSSSSSGCHLFDRFSNFQNEVGASTCFGDHAGSVNGYVAHPDLIKFHALQKTLPDMEREYPTCSTENLGTINYRNTSAANLYHQKGIEDELAASTGLFSCGSSFGLSDFGNIFAPAMGLESGSPSMNITQMNSDQLEIRYMQRVQSFSSESSTVSTATRARGHSTMPENTGESLETFLHSPTSFFSNSMGSMYGVTKANATCSAEVGQFPHCMGVQASENGFPQPAGGDLFPKMLGVQGCYEGNLAVLSSKDLSEPASIAGQLIPHAKGDGLSRASDILVRSSRKISAKQPPPAAPGVQRKKITVPSPNIPPVTYPPSAAPTPQAVPMVWFTKKTESNPVVSVAPPPVAPRVQRKRKTVASPIFPSLPYPPPAASTPPAASMVQHTNVALPPLLPSVQNPPSDVPTPPAAQGVWFPEKMFPPPVIPLILNPASSAPIASSLPAVPRAQRSKRTVSQLGLPSIAPKVQHTLPADPMGQLLQHSNIPVPSPVIPPVRDSASAAPIAPFPPAAPRARRTKKMVPEPGLPSIGSNVRPNLPVAPKVELPQHLNIPVPSPFVPSIANSPTVAPTPLAAYSIQLNTTMVPSPVIPSIAHPPSASFVAHTLPPPSAVLFTKMKSPSPIAPAFPHVPSVAPVPPVPASPLRIKWQDPDEFPPPMGEKCMICKRDLSFTAKGPVFQPAFPPAAAVLPCGRTFHDHCLQNITPQNQSTDPPCIPCAIGEE